MSERWPIYATLFGGQVSAPPGVCESAFTGLSRTDVRLALSLLLNCNSPGTSQQTSADFAVRATADRNGLVSIDDVNFGTHGPLTFGRDTEGATELTCTQGRGYAVALETGALPASQRPVKSGVASVVYVLFRDRGLTQLWAPDLAKQLQTLHGRDSFDARLQHCPTAIATTTSHPTKIMSLLR